MFFQELKPFCVIAKHKLLQHLAFFRHNTAVVLFRCDVQTDINMVMSPFLSSTGPTASLSSNLASNKTSSVNQLINRSSNCCGRSLIRPVLSAVWVAASPQCLPLVYITIHFVRSCLLYKGWYHGYDGHRTGGWGHPPLRRVTIDFVGPLVPSGPSH